MHLQFLKLGSGGLVEINTGIFWSDNSDVPENVRKNKESLNELF